MIFFKKTSKKAY